MAKDLVFAGENGRFSGYNFEYVIISLINNYKTEKQGYEIVSYIANDLKIYDFNSYCIYAEKCPASVKNRFGGNKKPPKSDIHIIFQKGDIKIKKGISIKSSNGSIQVQITNVSNFKEIIESNGINFPDDVFIGLSKFCGFGEYKPSIKLIENKELKPLELKCIEKFKLNTRIEKDDLECIDCINSLFGLEQSRRDRWLINELEEEEKNALKIFFTDNQEKITEIVLKEGFSEEEYFADYYLVNKNEYSATGIVDIMIDKMSNVIKESCKTGYIETKDGSFHIGKITVQMKGSGKKEAFHGLQFNKRG